jgi:hypothetical protein
VVLFWAALEGFHTAIAEVGGIALANHALDFCPNWLLGLTTGGSFVGLLWWFKSTSAR